MAYCEKADVLADFKALAVEDSGTVITTAKLSDIIDEESAHMDGRIAVRYAVPVTEPAAAMLILKRICVFLVAERVKNILEVKTGNAQLESDKKQPFNSVRTPKEDLDDIAKGDLLLIGAPLASAALGVTSFNSESCVSHVIDVARQQW